MVEGVQEKVVQGTGIIEGIYINILENNFKFNQVVYVAKDKHALYFVSKETQEDIKLITDRQQLEVWYKKIGNSNWEFADEIA